VQTGPLIRQKLPKIVSSLLFDVIPVLPEVIAVMPVFATHNSEAMNAGKELLPGHRVTAVLK
jgi:hypothetical protein